jgi:hypothetical protein
VILRTYIVNSLGANLKLVWLVLTVSPFYL